MQVCPDCPVGQAGWLGAYAPIFFLGGLFILGALGCLYWCAKSGQFKEIEEAKYRMLDCEQREDVIKDVLKQA